MGQFQSNLDGPMWLNMMEEDAECEGTKIKESWKKEQRQPIT